MLELCNIQKKYAPDAVVLQNLSFTLQSKESVAIVGASGKGKTTLLNLIGLLDRQFEGAYYLFGNNVQHYTARQIAVLRNQSFGFIFQQFLFVNHLTVLDNIALPLLYQGKSSRVARLAAMDQLEQFEMQHLAKRLPGALSGGQRQRITVMRALIHQPKCLLLDEPTSALDLDTQRKLMQLLSIYREQYDAAMIVVTHDPDLAQQCDRIWTL